MQSETLAFSNWKRFHEMFSVAFIHEALGAVAELEVAEHVQKEALAVEEIARKAEVNEGALYRTLRALAAYGIFEEVSERKFRHNLFSEQLKKSHPYSFHAMAKLWHSEPLRKAWGSFALAIKDGQAAFSHGNQMSIYEYLEKAPEMAELFHGAMENNSKAVSDSIARGFPFSDYGNVLDLGGGVGTLLCSILKYQPITGAVYDLPLLEESARAHLRVSNLSERAMFIKGNWFESVPTGFGIYLVKNSLWNWTDGECLKILSNIRKAMKRDSRLLILEYLPEPTLPWTTAFDLQQLNVTGGRGRTEQEYEMLLNQVGLKIQSAFLIANENALLCRLDS